MKQTVRRKSKALQASQVPRLAHLVAQSVLGTAALRLVVRRDGLLPSAACSFSPAVSSPPEVAATEARRRVGRGVLPFFPSMVAAVAAA